MYIKFIRITVVVMVFTGLGLAYGCNTSTWEDARKTDTYEAYQAYIKENPNGEHLDEAKKSAEKHYWNAVKNNSTARAFQKYLDEFPDGQFRSQAQAKLGQLSSNKNKSTKARVTGSNVIIRSSHTTESASAGVVAKEGTVVQILDQYNSVNSKEAILKREVKVTINGSRIKLPEGKAVSVLADSSDSVRASFTTPEYGTMKANIAKNDIEAIGGEKWYKIHTNDGITGWIFGKFIEEL